MSITVVGIGAEGWPGLGDAARAALAAADVIIGAPRQLALLPGDLTAERVAWPSPLLPAVPGLLAEHGGPHHPGRKHPERKLCVIASGDPMWYGIGARVAALAGRDRVRVLPHPSAISLACARLGWPVERVAVVSAVGRDLDRVRRHLQPGRRLLVLSADAATPARLAATLVDAGCGASSLTVLENLGGLEERRLDGGAQTWAHGPGAALNVVAVEVAGAGLSTVPGLPDDAYDSDGALTKREARALALARLAPRHGELLWDVGAGSGSIAIEWLRAEPSARAIAVENRPDRAERIRRNAATLGVPELTIVIGKAPDALAGLDRPDAVFVGGGLTAPGLLDACYDRLGAGGRLVAHAVTIEGERELTGRAAKLGGDLTRLAVERAGPLGSFTGWQPARPLVQWAVTR